MRTWRQIILERTQCLEFQNKALQISHAILDDIPLPILGDQLGNAGGDDQQGVSRQNMGEVHRQLEVGDSNRE